MTIEKQLEILEKALKSGAKIQFSFYNPLGRSKDDAHDLLDELSNGSLYSKELNESNEHFWFTGSLEGMNYSLFFEGDKEEKIRSLEQQIAKLKSESA